MMFKTPKVFIVFFVLLSMAIAIVYHHWPQIKAGQFLTKKQKEISFEFGKIKRDIASQNQNEMDELKSCQCLSDSTQLAFLQIEDKESCKLESLKFQKSFETMPGIFKEPRSQHINDFPRLCVIYALKQTDKLTTKDKKAQNSCHEGNYLCVTNEYVNVMYNSFGEVMNCLNIPQKDVFPYLFFRSRFQINQQFGAAGLNSQNIEVVKNLFEKQKENLKSMDSIHCQRIYNYIKDIPLNDSNQCYLSQVPENPILSFYLFAILFRENQTQVNELVDQIEHKEKLKKFGKFDTENDQLKITLTLTAIQFGFEKTKLLFQSYLLNANEGQSFQNFVIAENPKDEFFSQLIAVTLQLNREFKEGTCVSDSFLNQ